jgi:hypothetical protein
MFWESVLKRNKMLLNLHNINQEEELQNLLLKNSKVNQLNKNKAKLNLNQNKQDNNKRLVKIKAVVYLQAPQQKL